MWVEEDAGPFVVIPKPLKCFTQKKNVDCIFFWHLTFSRDAATLNRRIFTQWRRPSDPRARPLPCRDLINPISGRGGGLFSSTPQVFRGYLRNGWSYVAEIFWLFLKLNWAYFLKISSRSSYQGRFQGIGKWEVLFVKRVIWEKITMLMYYNCMHQFCKQQLRCIMW